MNDIYYVYAYLDPTKPGYYVYDNLIFKHEPFYIGKGKNNRITVGLNDNNNTKIKRRKINDILKCGLQPIILKLYENLSEKLSYNVEKEMIIKIGTLKYNNGPLINKKIGTIFTDMCINFPKIIKLENGFYFLEDGSKISEELFSIIKPSKLLI